MHRYKTMKIITIISTLLLVWVLPNNRAFGKRRNGATPAAKTSSASLPKCCEVCPEHFYEELALLEVPMSHKLHAIKKFHNHIKNDNIKTHFDSIKLL